MFIAIAIVCFVNQECQFINDHRLTNLEECRQRNQIVSAYLEQEPRVASYRVGCIPIPGEQT